MYASASLRGGWLAVFALVACWSSTPTAPTTPDARASATASPRPATLEGSYWCSITQGQGPDDRFTYPKFPCQIARDDGRLVLAKLGGSQRFTGEIAPDGRGGFSFAGQFYCPWGACTTPLHGTFAPSRKNVDVMVGKFSDDPELHVRLWRAPDAAFGGAAYGGYGYGGASYGGFSYGGSANSPHHHHR